MSDKSQMVLGYTRSGHAVLLPMQKATDMSLFVSWSPGDHLDASRILIEHGERTGDPVGAWCRRWAKAHKAIGKKAKKKIRRAQAQIRGGAEATILSRRGR
jgi:hypothetical protein